MRDLSRVRHEGNTELSLKLALRSLVYVSNHTLKRALLLPPPILGSWRLRAHHEMELLLALQVQAYTLYH